MTVQEINQYPSKNDKGEYAMYNNGKFIGYSPMFKVKSVGRELPVHPRMYPQLMTMIDDASKEGVSLTFAKAFVTMSEQIYIRQMFIKKVNRDKVDDMEFILNAPVWEFSPLVGLPGHSNHQDGYAIDFNVTGKPTVYAWLVKNAIRYGFVRTIPSERWHWEIREWKMFFKVAQDHPSWDGLV